MLSVYKYGQRGFCKPKNCSMRTKVTIKAILRKDKERKNGSCPIHYEVRLEGKTLKFSSSYYCQSSEWDTRKLAKDSMVKRCIKRKMEEFEEFVMELHVAQKTVSEKLIRDFFAEKNTDDVLQYYDEYIQRNPKRYRANTLRSYRSKLNILKEFRNTLRFGDITPAFLDAFDRFLAEERGLESNSRFGHHKNLKAVLSYAVKEGVIEKNPYVGKFEISKVSAKKDWLNKKELSQIENLKLDKRLGGLIRAKEMFLFACYTGLRYSDVVTLEWRHIGKNDGVDRILKEMIKTAEQVEIPLSNEALAILEKRSGINSKMVFENVSNQTLNYNLKELARRAKIEKNITFHLARHTFASIAINDGKSDFSISMILGHKDLNMTRGYTKTDIHTLKRVVDKNM